MQIEVDFPGGVRVDAHFRGYTVHTDQAVRDGGTATAPSPFDLFLASTATCAGFYVLRFCQQRELSTTGLRVTQRLETDPATGHVTKLLIDLRLPPDFPPKYAAAIIRAAEQCTVKKHLAQAPEFVVSVQRVGEGVAN
ncbi:MAG: OsmC family protein [Anaerolineales bacterium]|nr:OsmC family protein [Anaerolineales bacterium]